MRSAGLPPMLVTGETGGSVGGGPDPWRYDRGTRKGPGHGPCITHAVWSPPATRAPDRG